MAIPTIPSTRDEAFEALDRRVLSGRPLAPEEARAYLTEADRREPGALVRIGQVLLGQTRELGAALERNEAALREAQSRLEQMAAPPQFPADVTRVLGDGRLEVVAAGRRAIVHRAAEIAERAIRPGEEVLLNHDLSVALEHNAATPPTGGTATVMEVGQGFVVVRGAGDEETVLACDPELGAALDAGDRVVVRREARSAVARLPRARPDRLALAAVPSASFADIGGLDGIIAEIRELLDLHFLRRDAVARFGLHLLRGLTLVGPPGNGKTLLATAIAEYVGRHGGGARFFHVKPGALRGSFYGESEARIRALFDAARATPGIAVLFFDEIDSFGARGAGAGVDIDGRVLGALLTELNGLEATANVLAIGATNRLDLCDEALVRGGRLLDRLFHVPRPGREATRQILARTLRDDLPYAGHGAATRASDLIDLAVAYLFAPREGAGTIATVTLADGTQRDVRAPGVLSGALLASAAEQAKHSAAARWCAHASGSERESATDGIGAEDLLAALDRMLAAEAKKLAAPHAARRILDLEGADEIVRVEVATPTPTATHRHLRVA